MSYQEFWDKQSESLESAIRAVDGSMDENIVQQTGRWTAEQVALALDLQADDRVLELGCGVGRIGKELAPRCSTWIGSDISPNMLKAAATRLADQDNVDFKRLVRSSFEGLLQDGCLDKAYSVAVFCHMDKEDLFSYLKDLHRLIRPNGLLYVETWNLAHPVGWRRWEHEVRTWSALEAGGAKDSGRNQFCHPREFELYVRQAGFEVLSVYEDSPWVQIVAARDPESQTRQALENHLAAHAGTIAYSDTFTRCFEMTMDLANQEIVYDEFIGYLDSIADTPEGQLFRPYIEAAFSPSS